MLFRSLIPKNKEVGDLLRDVHGSLNILLIIVLIAHVAAALKHHFIDKDDILTRMLPAHRGNLAADDLTREKEE